MRVFFAIALLSLLAPVSTAAERHALLIGVSHYENSRLFLEGPQHDVAALQRILIDNWAFPESNVVILLDREVTRSRVVAELQALHERTSAGDHVFIYFSGHGTSSRDRGAGLPLPHTSGALIPADFPLHAPLAEQMEKIIIGQRDLRPLLKALDQGERRLFIAVDSCYSGNAVRGLYRSALPTPVLKTRYVGLSRSRSAMIEDEDLCGYRCGTRKEENYPYRNVFFLAASSDDEQAQDIGSANLHYLPTVDGKPHGAFSDALLRVLSGDLAADGNNDGVTTYDEAYRIIREFMGQRQYAHVPQMLPKGHEDATGLAARTLFEQTQPSASMPPAAKPDDGPLRVQVLGDDEALAYALDELSGVELVQVGPEVAVKRADGEMLLISGAGDLIARLQSPLALRQRIRQESWLKRLLHAPAGADFNLTLDLVDSGRGVTVVEGERVAFTVRSEQAAYLLLLDIDAKGRVNVLYPFDERELDPIQVGSVVQIPPGEADDMILVTPPFGTDQLLAYGFLRQPALLQRIMGRTLAPDEPLLAELERVLTQDDAVFARATLKLITVPRTPPKL